MEAFSTLGMEALLVAFSFWDDLQLISGKPASGASRCLGEGLKGGKKWEAVHP